MRKLLIFICSGVALLAVAFSVLLAGYSLINGSLLFVVFLFLGLCGTDVLCRFLKEF